MPNFWRFPIHMGLKSWCISKNKIGLSNFHTLKQNCSFESRVVLPRAVDVEMSQKTQPIAVEPAFVSQNQCQAPRGCIPAHQQPKPWLKLLLQPPCLCLWGTDSCYWLHQLSKLSGSVFFSKDGFSRMVPWYLLPTLWVKVQSPRWMRCASRGRQRR